MKTGKILGVIGSGESQEVELKESFHSSRDFSKLMCGFANTCGGIILVGVTQKKQIVGLKEDADEIQQKISASAQAVSPPILPSIELHAVEGKQIIATVIQKAIDGCFHTFQGAIWARVGSTLKKMEGVQILDFLRGKQILCFDETPSDAVISDIDEDKAKEYLALRRQQDCFKSHSIEDFLLSMRLAAKNGGLKIKNSALLFFAKNPPRSHPQNELKLVRFDGTEPVKIVSHELIQSNLTESIEKALSFVKTNLPKNIQVKFEARREERYPYPIDVICEAIVNAVAHRDYFSKDATQICLFSDRLEITNPGSLPTGLPRELFGTLSVQRNPLTYKLLRDYGYVEGLGSGIPRMINSMREYGLADPEFGIYEHFFRVILRNQATSLKPIKEQTHLNERQLKAIEFLQKNRTINTKTYSKINDISHGTAIHDINEMIKFGHLKKIGSYRGAYYLLKDEQEAHKQGRVQQWSKS
ncbi:MAG: RNA-binding domain-containing protein [Candidatus Altiarchaeota archaeon]